MSQVLVNGVQYGWGNITCILYGSPVVGITKIDYKRTQAKENLYGAGRDVIGRGYGNFTYDGSIEMYLEEWVKIVKASASGDPLQTVPFTITVVYGGPGVVPIKDILFNVEFLENPLTSSQGDTSIKVTIPIIMSHISRAQN